MLFIMFQYIIAIICFLWFIRVWICVVSAPYRFLRHSINIIYRCLKTCYTKTSKLCQMLSSK